jgi:hypothetical protein
VDPDDIYSQVPYEKGFQFLWRIERQVYWVISCLNLKIDNSNILTGWLLKILDWKTCIWWVPEEIYSHLQVQVNWHRDISWFSESQCTWNRERNWPSTMDRGHWHPPRCSWAGFKLIYKDCVTCKWF